MADNTLDPLHKLIAIEHDARQFGFDWPDANMIVDQAISECAEIKEAIALQEPSHRIQEEIGDLLHTAISLCVFAGYDVDQTLDNVSAKFSSRMQALKAITQQRGLDNLQGKSIEYMLEIWREAKVTVT